MKNIHVIIVILLILAIPLTVSAQSPDGYPCGNDGDCESGFCVDGYCCNNDCTGNCNKCNLAKNLGRCVPDDSACDGTDESCYCAGSCVACPSGTSCLNRKCIPVDEEGPSLTSTLPEPIPLSAPSITIIAILLFVGIIGLYKPELFRKKSRKRSTSRKK